MLLRTLPIALAVFCLARLPLADADALLVNIAGKAYGTQVVADCAYSDEHGAHKVVDGIIADGAGSWFSRDWAELPCALTFEFAAEEDLRSVVLYQAVWTADMYHSKEVAIEASDDGQEWRRITVTVLPNESAARVAVPVELRTRWVRLLVLTSYNPFQTCGLAEVELMAGGRPVAGAASWELGGEPAPQSSEFMGFAIVAREAGPQVALLDGGRRAAIALRGSEQARVVVPVAGLAAPARLTARLRVHGGVASATVALGDRLVSRRLRDGSEVTVSASWSSGDTPSRISLAVQAHGKEVTIEWSEVTLRAGDRELSVRLAGDPAWRDEDPGPPPSLPELRPAIEDALIVWDWRLRDGIGTPRSPDTYRNAIARMVQRGAALAADVRESGRPLTESLRTWEAVAAEWHGATDGDKDDTFEGLWLRMHRALRELVLRAYTDDIGPLLFVKHVPPAFSHQLTQYYGRYARPGGGLFVLSEPGRSMRVRQLGADALPVGAAMQPEVSHDGSRILFAYCEAATTPSDRVQGEHGRYYHLYEVRPDGGGVRQLTDGPYDDFGPRFLPDGRIIFVSTRRLGWHRCGSPGCENYTLAIANADGSDPRTVSYHETQEWDPAVLDDGRVIYTRWDYVDRHAVFYEHLWTVRPDGSNPQAYYGNNTFNPVGLWEARQVPGSPRVMATAAAHHAMTAGSIVLLDVGVGIDGLDPIVRLTPDAPFPESETIVTPYWRADLPEVALGDTPEQRRWPGHCYRSPYPLSDASFLVSYSYDGLIGEPRSNPAGMFGLYVADSHGNRELLYRDPSLSSVWPVPLSPRRTPPVLATASSLEGPKEGAFIIQDVRESLPQLPPDEAVAIRVLQLLPKSTPGANNPPVGLAFASPGKQVLGTAPLEPDGSAYFVAPAGVPLSFQVLDSHGMAIQVMRSVTYLQPGETLACTGCHESRTTAPPNRALAAITRPPSVLKPGPDGSRPLSYPLLVQPVLDRHCVSCHGSQDPAGGIKLTGDPEGHYTASYNALAPLVSYAEWKGGDFRRDNSEPLAQPGFFGARGSRLGRLLLDGHEGVALDDADLERLVTWMDANALFYGTFDPADQARQKRGERIEGPALE